MRNKWEQINFGEVQIENVGNRYIFYMQLRLNGINPDDVLVELYAGGQNGEEAEKIKMEANSIEDNAEYKYHAQVKATRPASDYTVRLIPDYENISVPLEDNLILWQR